MKCPQCGGSLRVKATESKPNCVHRRRICRACDARFTTTEKLTNASTEAATGICTGQALESIGQLLISTAKADDDETEQLVARLSSLFAQTKLNGVTIDDQ